MINLCIKQCTHCGWKYFCKTTSNNPEKYLGSGKHWKRHYQKHGREFITNLEIYSFQIQEEATAFALMFSEYNDIVNSPHWANLKPENALDGNFLGNHHSESTKKKITAIRTGTFASEKTKQKMSKTRLGKPNPLPPMRDIHKEIRAKANRGKKRTEQQRKNISIALKNIPKTQDHKNKISIAHKDKLNPKCYKPLCTPLGCFESVQAANLAYGVDKKDCSFIHYRIKKYPKNFYFI